MSFSLIPTAMFALYDVSICKPQTERVHRVDNLQWDLVLLFFLLFLFQVAWSHSQPWWKQPNAACASDTDIPTCVYTGLASLSVWKWRAIKLLMLFTTHSSVHLSVDLVRILICTWKKGNPSSLSGSGEMSVVRLHWAVKHLLTRICHTRVLLMSTVVLLRFSYWKIWKIYIFIGMPAVSLLSEHWRQTEGDSSEHIPLKQKIWRGALID